MEQHTMVKSVTAEGQVPKYLTKTFFKRWKLGIILYSFVNSFWYRNDSPGMHFHFINYDCQQNHSLHNKDCFQMELRIYLLYCNCMAWYCIMTFIFQGKFWTKRKPHLHRHMTHPILVQVSDCLCDCEKDSRCLPLWEKLLAEYLVEQFPAPHVLRHQVHMWLIFIHLLWNKREEGIILGVQLKGILLIYLIIYQSVNLIYLTNYSCDSKIRFFPMRYVIG